MKWPQNSEKKFKIWGQLAKSATIYAIFILAYPLASLWLDKDNNLQIDIQPYFKFDFCEKIANVELKQPWKLSCLHLQTGQDFRLIHAVMQVTQ